MSFLKNLFINLVSFILIGVLTVVVIVFIAVSSDEQPEMKENSILHINLSGKISDKPNSSEFTIASSAHCGKGMLAISEAIISAKDNPNVQAVFLEIGEISGGVGNLSSIRRNLLEFKKSGKKVYAYSDGMSQLGYYVSTVADSIFVHPVSHLEWKGLGAQLMYFKSMLDNIGVKAEPIRVGKFKSAIEPFILENMSEENEEQVKVLLDDIWKNVLEEVSVDRSISIKQLNSIADEYGFLLPKEALKLKMVDGVIYEDQLWEMLRSEVHKDFNLVSVAEYKTMNVAESFDKNKVVVLNCEGAIVDGKAETDISADQYTQLLEDVLKDKNVKALVVRVNSPGGSAKASEKIWRKLKLINEKIPVIVSMGNVAASGGYFIATAADTILAEKNTITGSIGVFGLMFNVEELSNNIGINVEKVKTNEMSDFPSFDRSLTNKEKSRIQKGINEIYSGFLTHVEEGRGMKRSQVEELAQGRVWSGSQALESGLVDEIGGLEDAISIAVNSAQLEKYRLVELPKDLTTFEKVIKTISEHEVSLPEPFVEYNYMIQNPTFFKDFSKAQTRLPFVITIN